MSPRLKLCMFLPELWIGQRVNGSDGGAPGTAGKPRKKRNVEPEHSARELGMSLLFKQLRNLGDGLSTPIGVE